MIFDILPLVIVANNALQPKRALQPKDKTYNGRDFCCSFYPARAGAGFAQLQRPSPPTSTRVALCPISSMNILGDGLDTDHDS